MKEQNVKANELKRLTEDEIVAKIEAHRHYIFRQVKGWKAMRADFSNCDLSGISFFEIAKKISPNEPLDLSGAIFFGADLSDADLSNTVLDSCDFRKAILSRSNLENVSCCGAYFSAARALYCNCNHAEFVSCDFARADFREASISEAIFDTCKLIEANFSQVQAERPAELLNCNGVRALFCGAHLGDCDLSESDFSGAVFSDADLSNATMNHVTANDTIFCGALMGYVTANNSSFWQANFTGADCCVSRFEKCNFYHAIFQWTNLTEAKLPDSHFVPSVFDTNDAGGVKIVFQKTMLQNVDRAAVWLNR